MRDVSTRRPSKKEGQNALLLRRRRRRERERERERERDAARKKRQGEEDEEKHTCGFLGTQPLKSVAK